MKILVLVLTLLLTACSSGSTVPDWQIDTQTAMARYTQYYLEGRSKLALASFNKARSASAATANVNAVAHLELVKCGVAMAALDSAPCTGYTALASTDPVDANYYHFLLGNWQAIDTKALPSTYQPILNANSVKELNIQISQISNPLSRLIATSVSVIRQQYDMQTLEIAINTASEQGWRRPLLAYLLMQEKNTVNPTQQQLIRARIDLLQSSLQNQ
jgi:hypothetical protein